MARAAHNGTKTQARRLLKPQPPEDCGRLIVGSFHPTVIDRHGEEQPGPETFGVYSEDGAWSLRCPYGEPGDLLWVKEPWRVEVLYDDLPPGLLPSVALPDYEVGGYVGPRPVLARPGRYRHARFMPQRFSRTLLEVAQVRVELVASITEDDALAEGVCDGGDVQREDDGTEYRLHSATCCREAFGDIWDSIHGTGAFDRDAWVWAITFRRIEP